MQKKEITFPKRASELPRKVVHKDQIGYKVWIVDVSIRAMVHIYDARYVIGGTTLDREKFDRPWENKVAFLPIRYFLLPKDFNG